jgi:hypothetical protein
MIGMIAIPVAEAPAILPARWYPLRAVAAQLAYATSRHRFNVVPAGRRSGKTERAKRKLIRKGLTLEGITHTDTPRFFAGAPTRDQAKRIYWDDLKKLSRPWWQGRPSETELTIRLITGSELVVVGMDKPERIEGSPWDGGVLDEYANMKAQAWGANVRPALSDRNGWCDLIGVPEGRNHYYDSYTAALATMMEMGEKSEWGAFTWKSVEVLPASEVAQARNDLDALTFAQEYEASFVNFEGRAYYAFTDAHKARLRERYNPRQPLIVCLDFNVAPGVAAVAQELPLPHGIIGTAVIGEVWIENNSNTPAVCRKLLLDWKDHTGRIEIFGDATGGARGTAKVEGSDWDLAKKILRMGDPQQQLAGFRDRVSFHVKEANPAERARVNAVNSRTTAIDGTRRLMIDPSAAPHVVRDLEGVRTLKGGSGEIDKKYDRKLTHITDALGYYLESRFPVDAESRAINVGEFSIG